MKDKVLALSMRPAKFSDLVGQTALVSAIQKQVAKRIPSAWMFSGESGQGKTTVARILATSLQCGHQKTFGEPCERCCRTRHSMISEPNASEANTVEEISKIAEGSLYVPIAPSRYRVIILDEAQRITTHAQNLLLKYLEEAPRTTIWIICTTEPNKILKPLRNRCLHFSIPKLSFESRRQFLTKYCKAAEVAPKAQALIEAAEAEDLRDPRSLLYAIEKVASGVPPKKAVSQVDEDEANTYAINVALTSGDWSKLREALAKASPDAARVIRSASVGWLRGTLLKTTDPRKRKACSQGILALAAPAPLEDRLLLDWLIGNLSEVCAGFSRL